MGRVLRGILAGVPLATITLVALEGIGATPTPFARDSLAVLALLSAGLALLLLADRRELVRLLDRYRRERECLEQFVARQAHLEAQLEITSAVRELALISTRSHDRDEVLQDVARLLLDLLDHPGSEVAIYLQPEGKDALALAALATDSGVKLHRRAAQQGPSGRILESVLRDAMTDRRVRRVIEHDRAGLTIGLDPGSGAIGALHVSVPCAGEEDAPFLERVDGLLSGVARHVALNLQKVSLYDQATLDALTGLYSKRLFLSRLPEMVEEARRLDRPLSCIVCDLDHFKRTNDTHGHKAGDQVLARAAAVLRRAVRNADLVFRYGGEELIVLTPQDTAGATSLAERIRTAVEGTRFRSPAGAAIPLTVSLGVSSAAPEDPRPDALFERADAAVYASKEAGRNRTTVAVNGSLLPALEYLRRSDAHVPRSSSLRPQR